MPKPPTAAQTPAHQSVFEETKAKRRPRPELSRDIVVAAALAILDREGAEQLSFRRLAADLGAGAASLYWYVPNREALLDLALDAIAAEVWDAIPARAKNATTAENWRQDLRQVAVEMYVVLGGRPWAGRQQLVSSDRGPNQLRIWDHLGRICFRAGLDQRDAFYAMTAVLSFVLGYVSQETAPDRDVDRESYLAAMGGYMQSLDADEFPALHRLVGTFVAHDQRSQFDAGLELLLDGIELKVDRLGHEVNKPTSSDSELPT